MPQKLWFFDRTFSSHRIVRAWSFVWTMLTIVHVTQSIWLSKGSAYPGNLGDSRFNQLVLEHGYQSLRGMATWDSPGQFYPAQHTLAYSDTHAGTLPIYAAVRRLGVSREEAWQLWFVLVTALNSIAAYSLLRTLGIARVLCGPLVFASVGSSTMVWFAGTHLQMLPIFPALFAWQQAIRWSDDRQTFRIFSVVGGFAWQFAAGPYSAFFALLIAFFVGVARCLMRTSRLPAAVHTTSLRAQLLSWTAATAIFLGGASLAAAVMRLYAMGMRAGHSRDLVEIIWGAPSLGAWFTANPINFWYPGGWPGGAKDLLEHAWFNGFLPWILLGVAVVKGCLNRDKNDGAWMLALATGALLTVLFFTKWTQNGDGLWIWLATHVEGLRAFRASGRVAGLLQFALIGAAGLLLTNVGSFRPSRLGTLGPVILACLLAAENLTHHQPFTSLADARARTDALVEAWRRSGDRPILAFAPGFTNQLDTWMELDAWSAALQLHRATINGYSGGLPPTHAGFAWNPTPENARDLMRATGIPEANVSIVETLGDEAERRLDYRRFAERELKWLADFDLQPIGWEIFAPLETFRVDGRPMHQFTPPAKVRFVLPESATHLAFDFRMRDGSYQGQGNSDGVGLTCTVRTETGEEIELLRREIAPREREQDRGTLQFKLTLPAGKHRTFILRVDPGPNGNNAWDWPLFGALRVSE